MKNTFFILFMLAISSIYAVDPNIYKHFSDDELNTSDTLTLYKEYLKDHKHKQSYTEEEITRRHENFKLNLKKLIALRAEHKKNPRNWVAGLNNLSDYSEEELNLINGQIPDKKDEPKALSTKSFLEISNRKIKQTTNTPLGPAINWVSYFGAVRNQGQCGCCWAFATTGAMEAMLTIKNTPAGTTPVPVPYFSPQHLVSCFNSGTSNYCKGSSAYSAMQWILSLNTSTKQVNGLMADSAFNFIGSAAPYTACPVNTPNALPSTSFTMYSNLCPVPTVTGSSTTCITTNGVKSCTTTPKTFPNSYYLANCQIPTSLYGSLTNGPVAVQIDGTAIAAYTGGIFDSPCTTLNHAVILVGYGIDPATNFEYYLIRNSWAATWGENGYIRVKRDSSNNNSCFIESGSFQPIFN